MCATTDDAVFEAVERHCNDGELTLHFVITALFYTQMYVKYGNFAVQRSIKEHGARHKPAPMLDHSPPLSDW